MPKQERITLATLVAIHLEALMKKGAKLDEVAKAACEAVEASFSKWQATEIGLKSALTLLADIWQHGDALKPLIPEITRYQQEEDLPVAYINALEPKEREEYLDTKASAISERLTSVQNQLKSLEALKQEEQKLLQRQSQVNKFKNSGQ